MSSGKPFYTYDSEADALYALLVSEEDAVIVKTVELAGNLHVDLDDSGNIIGVEILYPSTEQIDLEPLKQRFGIDLKVPFSFAA